MSWKPELEELARRTELAKEMGGAERVARARAAGRGTVRERIDALLDPGSFHETGALAGRAEYDDTGQLVSFTPSNFVCGRGRIDGRPVVVGGDDFTVRGGAADGAIGNKMGWAERVARDLRVPLVRLVDGTGGGGSGRPTPPCVVLRCSTSRTSTCRWSCSTACPSSRQRSVWWRGSARRAWRPRTSR